LTNFLRLITNSLGKAGKLKQDCFSRQKEKTIIFSVIAEKITECLCEEKKHVRFRQTAPAQQFQKLRSL